MIDRQVYSAGFRGRGVLASLFTVALLLNMPILSAQIIGGANDPTLPPDLSFLDDQNQSDSSAAEEEDRFSIEGAKFDYFRLRDPFLFRQTGRDLDFYHAPDPRRNDNEYGIARAGLGNLASASTPLLFGSNGNVGFDLNPWRHGSAWDPYRSSLEQLRYFRANKPYTKLKYTLGGGVEQIFGIEFARNIAPNLAFGFDYTRYVAVGAGQRQQSGVHDFNANAWYRTPNRRYSAMAGFAISVVDQEESGGVTVPSDSVFDFTTREAVPVFLQNALSNGRARGFHLYQDYRLGPVDSVALNDSVSFERVNPQLRFWHEARWNFDDQTYSDVGPDTGFYNNVFLRDDSTITEWAGQGVRNSIGFGNVTDREIDGVLEHDLWRWYVKATHRWDRPYGATNDTTGGIHDVLLEGWFGSHTAGGQSWILAEAGGLLNLKGEYRAEARAGVNLARHKASAGIVSERYAASRLEERFVSNHHIWFNDFDQELWISPELEYQYVPSGSKLSFRYHLVDNYRYFDTLSAPQQQNASMGVFQILLAQDFQFGRFHWDNRLAVQWSNSDLVRVPTYWGRHSFYFEGDLFAEAAFVRIGADVRFNTNYLAQAWNPAAAVFHLQNKQELQFYPVVDVFIAARIQTARVFISGYNLTQGLLEPGWYQTPGYPMPDLGIRFGVDWIFWW